MPGTDIPIISPAELVAATRPGAADAARPAAGAAGRYPPLAGRWTSPTRPTYREAGVALARQPELADHVCSPRSGLPTSIPGAQRRPHELVPGGAHTYARGRPVPECMAPVLTQGGRRVWDVDGNDTSSTAWACARSRSGTPTRPSSTPCRGRSPTGSNFSRPTELELEAAEDVPATWCPAPTWSSSPRTAPTPRPRRCGWPGRPPAATWSRSARPAVLLRRRLVHRHHRRCTAGIRRPRATADRRLRLQRPRVASAALLAERRRSPA